MDDKIKILMTGGGAPGGPGIIKSLQKDERIELHVADMNPNASGSHLSKNFHLIPSAKNKDFIYTIKALCKEIQIDLVFPLVTAELFILSQNKHDFEMQGTKILVSRYKDLLIANDKGALYDHLQSFNIKTPKFKIVKTKEDLEAAAANIGYPNTPVVIKPCIGNGSRGIRILDATKDRFDLLFSYKPNSLFTSLDEVLVSIGNNEIPPMVVSEYLPGNELTIDTIVDNGKLIKCLIRTRDSINSGISVSGRFIENEEVKNYIEEIVNSLPGLKGPIGFQVKQNKDGNYNLLESNPRIQGTSVAANGLGINLPLIAVHMFLENEHIIPEVSSGKGFVRYYSEVFYDC